MKSLAYALALFLAAATLLPNAAEARRIGGGGFAGMQRSMPRAAPAAVPARPATAAPQAAPATAGAAAAVPKRSWLGPIAGLAAGLGIAALMSHLGLGEGFGNIVMLLLLAAVAFFVIRMLMRRFMPANGAASNGGMSLAGAGAGAGTSAATPRPAAPVSFIDERPAEFRGLPVGGGSTSPAAFGAVAEPAVAATLPADFDAAGFERIAKMIFIRMQAANDSGDLADLRAFTTPEMFASVKIDLQDRGAAAQRTDVVRVDAEVLDVATEAERQIVSVRFHGLIREEADSVAEPFDEIWHLVKPADGSREWAIAGIQQSAPAFARAA
ncbi:MAG: TIM44-like domain-containing protein [Caldimonas sp.]